MKQGDHIIRQRLARFKDRLAHGYTDESLIELAKAGDAAAFEALVMRYKDEVYTTSFFMMGNPTDASDACQEVFIKLYHSLDKFEGRSTFSTWLYRLTVNTCIDQLRSLTRHRKRSMDINGENENVVNLNAWESISSPEDELFRAEKTEMLIQEIIKLDERYRIPLVLRDICGYSYNDISMMTNQPLGTVKSNIFRARRMLRDRLFAEELSKPKQGVLRAIRAYRREVSNA